MVDSPPTIYDVAELAGVSIATVSRAINSLDSVRPATRAKVMAAMDELDFVPNVVARGLSSGKHWILGLVFMRAPVDGSVLGVEEPSFSIQTSLSEVPRRARPNTVTRCSSAAHTTHILRE